MKWLRRTDSIGKAFRQVVRSKRPVPGIHFAEITSSNKNSRREMDSGKKQDHAPRVVSQSAGKDLNDFNWVRLQKLTYIDNANRERTWEMAERTTRRGEIDAVAIVAVVNDDVGEKPSDLILVSQFRPPLNCSVLELPAGLVDEGETAEQAALRELKEETGYVGSVVHVSPIVFSDPGLTNANMRYVTIQCLASQNTTPNPEQEDGEFITVHRVQKDILMQELKDLATSRGLKVDARLHGIAVGNGLPKL